MSTPIKGILLDLDGVFYMDNQLIHGAQSSIRYLRENKIPYRFVTNNSQLPRKGIAKKLQALGLDIYPDEILSANYLGVLYLQKKAYKNVRLILQPSGLEDYESIPQTVIEPDHILIGDIGETWTFALMNELMQQILAGAGIIALHKGRYFATQNGLQIDAGAFVAGLEYVTHTKAVVLGKPEEDFFRLALEEIGCDPEETLMVGDDLYNDIWGAQNVGIQAALVRTGKYRADWEKHPEIRPDHVLPSIAALPMFLDLNFSS